MARLDEDELRLGRDVGAATYVSSYMHLMMRELGVDDSDLDAVNALAANMVEPINIATEASFRALMGDTVGMDAALKRLQEHLDEIQPVIS